MNLLFAIKCTAFCLLFMTWCHLPEAKKRNLCENTTGCKCDLLWKSQLLRAECTGTNPDIRDLAQTNISMLIFKKVHFTNLTQLSFLRNITTMDTFYIRQTKLSYFNWNWLPESCGKLTVSGAIFNSNNFSPLNFQDQNGNCYLRPSLNITRLYIFSVMYQNIPSCLPASLTVLSMVNTPLTAFGLNTSNNTKWPVNLKTVHLKSINFSTISEKVFQNSSTQLTTIIIFVCKRPLFNFPTNWPSQSSIKTLTIRNCQVKNITSSDFDKLQQLQKLDLTGNKLEMIPNGLPKTLQSLTLNQNFIKLANKEALKNLNNLTKLFLERNQIEFVSFYFPKNLEVLDLGRNMIQYIDESLIRKLRRLRHLDLSHNRLITMPQNLQTTLKTLDISYNLISVIHSSTEYNYCTNCLISMNGNHWVCNNKFIQMLFWSTKNNVTVILDKKTTCDETIPHDLKIDELSQIIKYLSYITNEKIFQKCVYKVKILECVNASLTKLPKKVPMPILITATITQNPNLTAIPVNYFIYQKKLTKLNLEENAINQFPIGLPSSLKIIILDSNQINSISNEVQPTLNNLTQLETLSLRSNQIKVIHYFQLKPLVKLKNLKLSDNPLVCDCFLYSLVRWYIDHNKLKITYSFPTCALPISQKGKAIVSMIGYFTYTLMCIPPLCHLQEPQLNGVLNCSKPIQKQLQNKTLLNVEIDSTKQPYIFDNSYWQVLDFSYLELNQTTIHLQHLPLLQTVNFTGNNISSIPLTKLPKSLEILILINNSIGHIPSTISQYLPKLKLLDLTKNNIKVIPKESLQTLEEIRTVLLQNNPLVCDCNQKSFINYIQVQRKNSFNNSKFKELTCNSPNQLKGYSLFNLTKNDYCNETWPKIMGISIGGLSILLVIAIVASMFFYKRRKLQEKKDIVTAFRQLLEKEAFANTEKQALSTSHYEYDAFVSYCNNTADEDFVYKMLQELEDKRGKRLCIHERNFTAGRGIADNIVNCITMSRRMILVLSKKYTTSSWCQYEVQVALAQMHQHRKGKLLIPILLEDVVKNNTQEGSVKTILSLISGIHVPSANQTQQAWEYFWNSLEKSISDDNKTKTLHVFEVD